MNLLFFRKIDIVSNLTEKELLKRLTDTVGFERKRFSFNNPKPNKQYLGNIEGKKFKIYRNAKGRNSFIPVIQGNIVDKFTTRNIMIKMRPHWGVILFLLWILCFVVYYLLKLNDWKGLVLFVLICGMTIFFFNIECNKSIKDLKQILGIHLE